MAAKYSSRLCTILLRLLALGATLSAAVVMATSHETSEVLSLRIDAKYSHTPSFKYFMIVNAIVCVYTLLVVFLPQESPLWRLVVALDVVMTMLLTSAISAALAIGYVGKKGNPHAGWLPICGQFPKFCKQITGALAAGFIGDIIYTVLLLNAINAVLNPLLV